MGAPTDLHGLLAGGGLTALAGGLVYIGKLGVGGLQEMRANRRPGLPVAKLTDEAASSLIVINSLKAVAEENVRMSARMKDRDDRIDELEATEKTLRAELAKRKEG